MLLGDAPFRVVYVNGLSLPRDVGGWFGARAHDARYDPLIQGILEMIHEYHVIDGWVRGGWNKTSFDAYDLKTRKKFFRCHRTLSEGPKLSKGFLCRVRILKRLLKGGQEVRVRVRDGDQSIVGEGTKVVLGPGFRMTSTKVGEDEDDLICIRLELTRVRRDVKLDLAFEVFVVGPTRILAGFSSCTLGWCRCLSWLKANLDERLGNDGGNLL